MQHFAALRKIAASEAATSNSPSIEAVAIEAASAADSRRQLVHAWSEACMRVLQENLYTGSPQ